MKKLRLHTSKLILLTEAFDALRENRLRTALSLLGIAIGIASIIVVGSISGSGREIIFKELETFGLRTFWVFREIKSEDTLNKDATGTGITIADYRDLSRIGWPITRLSPVVELGRGQMLAMNGNRRHLAKIQGVGTDFLQINGDELTEGRFFDTNDIHDYARVAVIGPAIRERLFPDESSALGRRITIDGEWYSVIGVLKAKSRDLISSLGAAKGDETAARILVPYTAAQMIIGDADFVSYLQGQSSELESSALALTQVKAFLSTIHGNSYRYRGESMASYVETANRILGIVSLIGLVAASVSLLVGGLAIMNIMTTSVIERTQEIGLRRAIGATKQDIRWQFLAEAVQISLTGGIVGVAFGLIIVFVISATVHQPIKPALMNILYAVISTFLVGIISGLYPAKRAAELLPVEALRHA
jgi:putative ABC transport system permease protein